MTVILLWVISGLLITLSLWVIIGNLWITFGGLFKKRKSFESLVPFIGGLVGMVGVLLMPVSRVHCFWWVSLVVDLGCGPMLAAIVIDRIMKTVRRK